MIAVVGGIYDEKCLHPHFDSKFGSGLRACFTINNLNKDSLIEFHTFCSEPNSAYLDQFEKIYGVKSHKYPSENTIGFYYDHPLKTPVIVPRPDLINRPEDLVMESENILCYGFLEGNAIVKGKKVVYDPQSPVNPIPFKKTHSSADELAIVINIKEAELIAKSKDINKIKSYFFETDGASILIVKMGPKGAMFFTASGASDVIPVYKTDSVWPIGSGDVFAAVFAYYWMEVGTLPIEAAKKASSLTALYCNSRNYSFKFNESNFDITPLKIKDFPEGLVYLAGPFFSYPEKWLVNEIYSSLIGMGMNVFSPWHDVGEGTPDSSVAQEDIIGLEKSKIVFAIVDGLDSGTLFEIGFAIKMKIPVIAYVENESPEDLTMLIGTGCVIERDMTTALYKCLWMLAENE